MTDYQKMYQNYLDKKNIRYILTDNVITFLHNALDGSGIITLSVSFSIESNDNLSLTFISVLTDEIDSDEKLANSITLCNQKNNESRGGKYYTLNNRIVFSYRVLLSSLFFDFSYFCDFCSDMIRIMTEKIDNVQPEFMKILLA